MVAKIYKVYKLLSNILLRPDFLVAIVFLLFQCLHYHTTNKLKYYFSIVFPLSFQASCSAVNATFLLENCPNIYQPSYLVLIFSAHIIFTWYNLTIFNKFNKRTKNKISLITRSYTISICAMILLAYTMRIILFKI